MCSHGFTFAPPKIWKTENPGFGPAIDVLEICPERRRLRRQGGGEVGRETGREAADLEPWDGEPGWLGGRLGLRDRPGVEGLGRQVFRISGFQISRKQTSVNLNTTAA